jgi:hypothetical protein
MSNPFDPRELDLAWDSMFAGRSTAGQVGDEVDRDLLALLGTLPHAAPSSHFVHTLERALFSPVDSMNGQYAAVLRPISPQPDSRRSRLDIGGWLPVRRSPMRYASAAIALVLVIAAVVLILQRQSSNEPVIPAINAWTDEGPSTSLGVTTTTLFTQQLSSNTLHEFEIGQWGWMALDQVAAMPGEESHPSDGSAGVGTSAGPGLGIVGIETGSLAFQLDQPVYVARSGTSELTRTEAGAEITLGPGDAILFDRNALAAVWNPTSETTHYLAGGFFSRPGTALYFPTGNSDIQPYGISLPNDALASATALELTMANVTIGPGEIYAYKISAQSLMLAKISGDGLVQQRWSGGKPEGNSTPLLASSYALHHVGAGYYTLTNRSDTPIEVSVLEVKPPDSGALGSPPSEPADVPPGNSSLTQPAAQPAPIPE